jgi:putative toxin-antitoxin system antitoxin component (TIGR02293 family)
MTYPTYNPRQKSYTTKNNLAISLDIPSDPLEAHLWIVSGVSPYILVQLAGLVGSDIKAICHLTGISQRTIRRKIKSSTPLTLTQGARVYGSVQALDAVISLHEGDLAIAMSWLDCSAKGLGGEKPSNILTTAMGVQAVLDLVGRIEHGVVI